MHLDLKPEHFMRFPCGQWKLVDYGSAHREGATVAPAHSRRYCAPELASMVEASGLHATRQVELEPRPRLPLTLTLTLALTRTRTRTQTRTLTLILTLTPTLTPTPTPTRSSRCARSVSRRCWTPSCSQPQP